MTVRWKGCVKITEGLSSYPPACFQRSSARTGSVKEELEAVRLAKEMVIRSDWSRAERKTLGLGDVGRIAVGSPDGGWRG